MEGAANLVAVVVFWCPLSDVDLINARKDRSRGQRDTVNWGDTYGEWVICTWAHYPDADGKGTGADRAKSDFYRFAASAIGHKDPNCAAARDEARARFPVIAFYSIPRAQLERVQ